MALVWVAVGFMTFLAASTLAIDVGMFMTARAQAQNAADAGALSGATALVYDSFTDHSAGGPAVQSAINDAVKNDVIGHTVSVKAPDVTFPAGTGGEYNRVKVNVFRTADRQNPVATLIGPLFGVPSADVSATATAEASPANAETCVKPFTIPDKWTEKQTGPWDPTDTFDLYDNKGKPLPNPDVYIGPSDAANYTGYNAQRDRGTEIQLKADNNTKITASFYDPWDLPGSVGASDYRANIDGCNSHVFPIGSNMPPETGNMVGPTQQGMQDLIDLDPNAYWDTSCNCVQGSAFAKSPRVVVIPVYDPVAMAEGQQHGKGITLTVVNFIGFFIEPMQGGTVVGRITPVAGVVDGNAGAAPPAAFPRVIRLVE